MSMPSDIRYVKANFEAFDLAGGEVGEVLT
jgi:hypothetical protein